MDSKTDYIKRSKLLMAPLYEIFIIVTIIILYVSNGFSQSFSDLNIKKGCKGYLEKVDIYPHYLFINDKNNIADLSNLLFEINKEEDQKVFNKWLLKENRDGIKIYYRWIHNQDYMELKLDNTNLYSASVSFQPLIYCWKCIDNSSNQHTHVFMNPNSSMKININIKCENQLDTDMVLEKLVVYK